MSQTPEGYRASWLYYTTYIINEVILHLPNPRGL